MKSKLVKLGILVSIFTIILFNTKVDAATFGLKASKTEVTPGESFSVTISGIYGKVTISGSNVGLSASGSQFVDGSLTITATTKSEGTAKVTVTAVDAATTGASPQEVTGTKTVNVTVKAKTVVQPQQPATQPVAPSVSTKKTTTTPKKETKKTPIKETTEKEEASSQWGIHSLKLIGVKENGEEVELALNEEFKIQTYDYTCNVENDIKTVKIEKEAYEYNDLVQVSGLEEELKVGENQIVLKLAKEGKDELNYRIKLIKEESKQENEDTQQVSAIVEETKPEETLMVSIPLIWFIILEIVIVGVSAGITVLVMTYLKQNKATKENNK